MRDESKLQVFVNNILFYGFFALGLVVLIFFSSNENIILFAFGSFLASWVIEKMMKKRKIAYKFLLFINLGLWLNIFGELGLFYHTILYYDKILHFTMGILIAAWLYEYYTKNLKTNREIVFFTALGVFAIWEIYEYFLQSFLGYPAMGVWQNGIMIQSPFDDTMFDLIFGSLGALLYLVLPKKKKGGRE